MAGKEDDDQRGRRGGILATTCAFALFGYFLVFPPACYWIQDAGAAPEQIELLSKIGKPCRFLGQHFQPYQAYIGWCYEISEARHSP